MKRISYVAMALALCVTPSLRGQDAATEERLNKLSGQIENMLETQQALSKQIDRLSKDIDNLREQLGKPTGNFASQEDLKTVVKSVEEVDKKRMQDAETIKKEFETLKKLLLKDTGPAPHGSGK